MGSLRNSVFHFGVAFERVVYDQHAHEGDGQLGDIKLIDLLLEDQVGPERRPNRQRKENARARRHRHVLERSDLALHACEPDQRSKYYDIPVHFGHIQHKLTVISHPCIIDKNHNDHVPVHDFIRRYIFIRLQQYLQSWSLQGKGDVAQYRVGHAFYVYGVGFLAFCALGSSFVGCAFNSCVFLSFKIYI